MFNVIHDLYVAYSELGYLPRTMKAEEFNPKDKPFETEFDYMNEWPVPPSFTKLLMTTITRQAAVEFYQSNYMAHDRHPDKRFYFINGIMTTLEMAKVNAMALSLIFGTKVDILYNPTKGLVRDLAECIRGRTFDNYSSPAISAANHIIEDLKQDKKVIVIGHSQGGIIASNVARILMGSVNSRLLENVEFYTFASAMDEFKFPNISEHFANRGDYVARIGTIHLKNKHPDKIDGSVYVDSLGEGHLLNAHYLKRFIARQYCRGNSKLYSYTIKAEEDRKLFEELSKR